MDFGQFEVLTFDCYGTLIDWASGILGGIRPVLEQRGLAIDEDTILERYAALEARLESGPYLSYHEVLQRVAQGLCEQAGFLPDATERECLVRSFADWRPFPDTVEALHRLKQRYKLAIISNVDDDLFALSARHLEVPFDFVITAQQVGSYKPSLHNFEFALERIAVPRQSVLHVAQSLFHDTVPAKQLGLANVWVNRQQAVSGFVETLSASQQPDLEVPDLRTLATLAWGS